MRTREALSALIEGRLASPAGRSELVELATRLIIEEALEGEVRDALDRGYYERGDAPGQGHRNGHRTHRLKNGAHRGAREPGGRDARAGPVGARHRKILCPFKDETGRLLLSKTAVSNPGKWSKSGP